MLEIQVGRVDVWRHQPRKHAPELVADKPPGVTSRDSARASACDMFIPCNDRGLNLVADGRDSTAGNSDNGRPFAAPLAMNFRDLIERRWSTQQSLLCVGLDPDPMRIPAHLRSLPDAVFRFCAGIVDATAGGPDYADAARRVASETRAAIDAARHLPSQST